MSDEKSDNVLIFIMVGGVMLASEEVGWGEQTVFIQAVRPDNGERYWINMRNVLTVQFVPREVVISGKRIVEPVGNLGGLH